MDNKISNMKDVENTPMADKENEKKHNYEPREDNQETIKLEIVREEDEDNQNTIKFEIEKEETEDDQGTIKLEIEKEETEDDQGTIKLEIEKEETEDDQGTIKLEIEKEETEDDQGTIKLEIEKEEKDAQGTIKLEIEKEEKEDDQETIKLEIEEEEEKNLIENYYLPVKEEKERYKEDNLIPQIHYINLKIEVANKEEDYSRHYNISLMGEKLIDEPILCESEGDPLELKSSVMKEDMDEEFNEHSKGNSNYQHRRGNEDLYNKEMERDEQKSKEIYDNAANKEEFFSIPVLNDEFDRDPLELETDVKKEIMGKEFMGSCSGVLGEDIMERIYCDICDEYNRVTEFSFRHKLGSFCDTCYHNHLRKAKSNWMDVMYEWYKSCVICLNGFCSNLDLVKHDCTCKNVYYCYNCSFIIDKIEDIERHVLLCVSQSSSLHNIAPRKSIEGRIGLAGRSGSESHFPKDKRHIVRRTCKLCKKLFSRSGDLMRHLRTHTGEKQFLCQICKKLFSRSDYLKNHLRIHSGEKPFSCRFCKISYSQSSSLRNHLRLHHHIKKLYFCQSCEKSFSSSYYLKRHLRTHPGESPFSCKFCKKLFSRNDNLRVHLRTHTGEKPVSCKFCKKSFSRSDVLKVHLRIHTGEKPFSCKLCKKLFSRSDVLKVHLRTHSGEKPFFCKLCKRSFSQSGTLKNHMHIHKSKKP